MATGVRKKKKKMKKIKRKLLISRRLTFDISATECMIQIKFSVLDCADQFKAYNISHCKGNLNHWLSQPCYLNIEILDVYECYGNNIPSQINMVDGQAATNPLSDCPGQLKILLGNQKFKVLYPNWQLKSRKGTVTEYKLKFCYYFWHFKSKYR